MTQEASKTIFSVDGLSSLVRRCGGERRFFWLVLAIVAVARLLLAGRFGLSTDESHYAMFARNLAWGYFDHPPMVAFLGALTSALGDHAFFYRLGPILCSLLALVLLRALARNLYPDERMAPLTLLLFLLLPVHFLLGIALLPDATLNLFWCAGLWAAWHAFETRRWAWWLLTGALFGGMLLSKYHGVLFPLCLFAYVISGRETRAWLWSPKPYAAGLVGFLIFLPNILWNAHNGWISYLYQLGHGGGRGVFEIENMLEATGGQLAAGTPVLFIMLMVAAVGGFSAMVRTDKANRFALCASMPVFAFFILIGLFGKILPHWPAVGWFGGTLLLAAALIRSETVGGGGALHWRRWTRVGVVTALILNGLMLAVIALPILPPFYRGARAVSMKLHERIPAIRPMPEYQPKFDITNDLYGWNETARQVEALRAAMPNPDRTFVFCHRFYMTSQLAVHMQPDTVATSLHRRPSQYQVWFDPAEHGGWDALFVDYHNRWHQGPERYRSLFERIDPAPPVPIKIDRRGETIHRFDVYRYYGFQGQLEGE